MVTNDMAVDVSQDWLHACSVQERFMRAPARNLRSVDYSASCRQMRALGGDCYDFSCTGDGRITMLVGDASGKGVAAALMMASVQASLRTAALFTGDNLAGLLRVVNAHACDTSSDDRYATLFYVVLDQATRTLRYVNAGHNAPIVLRSNGSIECLESSGAPVGLFPDASWQERTVQLQPGDRVLAYTDGVTEACNRSGNEWGVDGLLQAATDAARVRETESADALVRSILDAMDDFSGGVQTDDATAAVMRIL
jgi:phosphoserine phosphatase RsbU/P